MQVVVRDNDVNGALRVLEKKIQRDGVLRELNGGNSTTSRRRTPVHALIYFVLEVRRNIGSLRGSGSIERRLPHCTD